MFRKRAAKPAMRHSTTNVARLLAPLVLGAPLLLGACTGASNNMLDSAFPNARWGQARAGLDGESFTMRRVLGEPDNLQPLREDPTFNVREADGRTLRDLLDVEGTRPNIYEQQEREGQAARRGSSSPPPPPRTVPPEQPAPRASLAPAPAPAEPGLRAGQVVPGTSGGTVVSGGTGRAGTTIGPSGQAGTAVRDGNTITLFGADGSIRTVPAPR